jgi:hypothetical protein
VATALAIAPKLFLWPLVFWLLATRRLRAAGIAIVVAAGLVLVSWAAIGFDGFSDYPHLLRVADDFLAERSLSVTAFIVDLGAGRNVARAIEVVLAVSLLAAVILLGRRPGGDVPALTAAICAALVASSVVWAHYYALLFVPIAARYRRIALAWFLPASLRLIWVVGEKIPPKERRACCPRALTEAGADWTRLPFWFVAGSLAVLVLTLLLTGFWTTSSRASGFLSRADARG